LKIITFDIEADGFQESVSKMHCLVAKNYHTKEVRRFYDEQVVDKLDTDLLCKDSLDYLADADVVVGHNLIGYDFDILDMFYGRHPTCKVVDTLVWSQVLNPDRRLPKGCPATYINPLTGKAEKITPHSLAAWGYRVSRSKPAHFDWMNFSEDMLHRCVEDVEISELVLLALLKEAGMDIEEIINVG